MSQARCKVVSREEADSKQQRIIIPVRISVVALILVPVAVVAFIMQIYAREFPWLGAAIFLLVCILAVLAARLCKGGAVC
jgi:hypothetical protein